MGTAAGPADRQHRWQLLVALPTEMEPFKPGPWAAALDCQINYAATGDLNGDGKPILSSRMWGCRCGGSGTTSSGYFVAWEKAMEPFSRDLHRVCSELYAVTLADMNRDGNLDLLLDDAPSRSQAPSPSICCPHWRRNLRCWNHREIRLHDQPGDCGDYNSTASPTSSCFGRRAERYGYRHHRGNPPAAGNGDGTFGALTQIGTGISLEWLADRRDNDGIRPGVAVYTTVASRTPTMAFHTAGGGKWSIFVPMNTLESLASQPSCGQLLQRQRG